MAWAFDDDVDIDYHLRRSALPRPGRVRDLLELTSRLHGTLLDRHRPLWEAHLIEGLDDGRFAVYIKIHHSLLDGVSAQRLIDAVDDRRIPTIASCGCRGRWDPEAAEATTAAHSPSALQSITGAVAVAGLASRAPLRCRWPGPRSRAAV